MRTWSPRIKTRWRSVGGGSPSFVVTVDTAAAAASTGALEEVRRASDGGDEIRELCRE
jgi:hypothetical protein